ncbi:TPA: replication initiation protein [Salmonella enterica subsp. enterica serovar Virchow]
MSDGIKEDQETGQLMLEVTGAMPYAGRNKFRHSSALIDAAYSLSIFGKRVLWLCLSDLDNAAEHPGAFRLTPAVYRAMFKTTTKHSWSDLRDGIRSLQKDGGITFKLKDGRYDEHWMPWLMDVYALRSGTPNAEYLIIFNPRIVAQMKELKHGYAKLAFNDVGRITSDKQARLYEKCCQTAAFGGFTATPEQLHKLCDITGLQATNAAELKRRFLDPAVKRLNAVTPLDIAWFREKETGKYRFIVTDTREVEKANTDGLPVEPEGEE